MRRGGSKPIIGGGGNKPKGGGGGKREGGDGRVPGKVKFKRGGGGGGKNEIFVPLPKIGGGGGGGNIGPVEMLLSFVGVAANLFKSCINLK